MLPWRTLRCVLGSCAPLPWRPHHLCAAPQTVIRTSQFVQHAPAAHRLVYLARALASPKRACAGVPCRGMVCYIRLFPDDGSVGSPAQGVSVHPLPFTYWSPQPQLPTCVQSWLSCDQQHRLRTSLRICIRWECGISGRLSMPPSVVFWCSTVLQVRPSLPPDALIHSQGVVLRSAERQVHGCDVVVCPTVAGVWWLVGVEF